MTLSEAIATLAERCTISADPADAGAIIVASGGETDDADKPPLLCATRDLAVKTWLAAVEDMASPGSVIHWAEKPGMYRFQITVSNADTMTHRVVEDRFAVVCALVVESEA